MIYSRDEVANELTSFYEFLVDLYLPGDAIKRPPPGEWPHLTPAKLRFLDRNETVIDLLRRIPYLRTDSHNTPLMIYDGCACNDYSDQSVLHGERESFDPPIDFLDGDTGFITAPHMVTIARAYPWHAGFNIFCNTRDGTLDMIDLMDGTHTRHDIKQFFNKLKTEYRTLVTIPIGTDKIVLSNETFLSSDQLTQLKHIYMKHGWLSSWFRKEKCTAEVKQFWNSTLSR